MVGIGRTGSYFCYLVPEPFQLGSLNHRTRPNPCSCQLFILYTTCPPNFSGSKNIALPPQPHLIACPPTATSQWGQAAPTARRWRRPWGGASCPAYPFVATPLTGQPVVTGSLRVSGAPETRSDPGKRLGHWQSHQQNRISKGKITGSKTARLPILAESFLYT